MPNEVDPRFERYRISEGRDIYGDTLKPYDPSREERRTEQDTNLYKDYGFAMTESQKELEDQYKKSVTKVTDIYTPVTDFEKAYQEWYQSGIQPEVYTSPGYSGTYDEESGQGIPGILPQIIKVGEETYRDTLYSGYEPLGKFDIAPVKTRVVPYIDPDTGESSSVVESFVGISGYTRSEEGESIPIESWVPGDLNYTASTTGQYIPKELTDPNLIGKYLTNPAEWESAFRDKWFETNPAAYSEANVKFYEATTKLAQEKTDVYNQLGIRTNNRLYLDESNNYDKTVMNMQQRFEDRIAKKQATLNQIMQVK